MARGYWAGLLFFLPLAANRVAQGFGWYVFYLADPGFQWFWGTAVQAGAGWPFFAGAAAGRPGNLAVALPSLGLYGYSLVALLLRERWGHSLPLLFDLAAALPVVAGGVMAILGRGRNPGRRMRRAK